MEEEVTSGCNEIQETLGPGTQGSQQGIKNVTKIWGLCVSDIATLIEDRSKTCSIARFKAFCVFWQDWYLQGICGRHRDSIPPSADRGTTTVRRLLALLRWLTSTLPTWENHLHPWLSYQFFLNSGWKGKFALSCLQVLQIYKPDALLARLSTNLNHLSALKLLIVMNSIVVMTTKILKKDQDRHRSHLKSSGPWLQDKNTSHSCDTIPA